jgi:hypothetical protein
MTLQLVRALFVDAEAWAAGYLRTALAARSEAYKTGVVVGTTVPRTRPARLVTVRRDGGAPAEVFDVPRFGVNVYAATEEDVSDLAALVAALLRIAPGDGTCVSMRQLSGPNPIPDESGTPRRFSTFEAHLRGGVLS